jgi:hypothetical protein
MGNGPDDEPDTGINGDPDSHCGEEDESGYDDMPVECGWDDFDFEFEDDDGDAGDEVYSDDGDDE